MIELLVAMVLLAFGILSAITLEMACVRGNTHSASMDEASGLAQFKLEELRQVKNLSTLTSGTETSLNAKGEVTANGLYTRTWTVSNGPTTNSKQVRVEVSWSGLLGVRSVSLRDLATGGVK